MNLWNHHIKKKRIIPPHSNLEYLAFISTAYDDILLTKVRTVIGLGWSYWCSPTKALVVQSNGVQNYPVTFYVQIA